MAVGNWRRGEIVLGRYEVLDVLDNGGMGLVFRVRHRDWQTDLALKVPRPELLTVAADGDAFAAEAGTWAGLDPHPHVVNCVYVRRIDGSPCVFAEWVDGGNLAERVRGHRPRGGEQTARVLDLAVQIAWGIAHAHQGGVVHQDIKPANVMVTGDGIAKVSDFGLANARAAAGESAVAPPGVSLFAGYGGMTPAYCSPEQAEARAGARLAMTRATDVWSWALCVLEMFTGGPPCRLGQSAPEVFEVLVEAASRGSGVAAMPRALVDLLRRCFTLDPAARPHDLDGLAAEVAAIHADTVGEPYPRARPAGTRLLADGLSNRALSLLDLGREEEAELMWREAAGVDPHHPSAVHNWALYRWRRGRIGDTEVVSALRAARTVRGGRGDGDPLLGLVQLERGADDEARALLADAPGTPEFESGRRELARRPAAVAPLRVSGHRGGVSALAVDGAGTVALSGGAEGCVRVWDLPGGRCRHELSGARGGRIVSVAVSADGRHGVVARRDGPVEWWDLATGTPRYRLTGRPARVTAVAVTSRGVCFLGDEEGRVGRWEPGAGPAVRELGRHGGTRTVAAGTAPDPCAVTHVAAGEDGAVVVSVAEQGGLTSVYVWDTALGRVRHRLERSADLRLTGLDRVALSPDGGYALLTGRFGSEARIWATHHDRVRDTVPDSIDPHVAVALSADGTIAVSGGTGGHTARVWETGSGRCLRTFALPSGGSALGGMVSSGRVTVSGDASTAVVADQDGGLWVHRLPPTGFRAAWSYARPRSAADLGDTASQFGELLDGAARRVSDGRTADAARLLRTARSLPGFERHPDLRSAWAALGRGRERTGVLAVLRRYDMRGGTWTFTPRVTLAVESDGDVMITGGADGALRVWELQSGRSMFAFPDRAGKSHTVLIAEDEPTAVTADWSGTAFVWDLEGGVRRDALLGKHGRVKCVAMSADGRYGLVGDEGGALVLWRLRPAAAVRVTAAHTGPVSRVALSRDGRYAVSTGHQDRIARVWRTATGEELFSFPLGTMPVGPRGMRFSPDGERLYVNALPATTCWEVPTGRGLFSVEVSYRDTLAMSADCRVGVTSGVGCLVVWDAVRGGTIRELPDSAVAFDISPDGGYVLSAGYDHTLRLWDVRTGRCAHVLDGHPTSVTDVLFTADGRNALSTDARPAIRLWEFDWDHDFGPAVSP
ncbi:protein kinase [Streptomyces uncialis]|uniref:protein kinase domain-containing protein n=1 Tax=Streptomyces uncialis TaxID=1048205 RepID=UPI00365BA19F